MKILYDHQMFSFQKFGGITRYFTDLIAHLPATCTFSLPLRYSENYYLEESGVIPTASIPWISSFRVKRQFYYYYNQQLSQKSIAKNDFDLFHPTYYDDYFLKRLRKPLVITIHDMIHEKFKGSFSSSDPTSRKKLKLAQAADHIIAVSRNTKHDIMELFGIPESKISIVYHGYTTRVKPAERLFENYILYVGDRKGYKNFRFFIEAVQPLLHQFPELKVVCTNQPFTAEEIRLFNRLGIGEQTHQVSVDDAQLASLYMYAELFAYPSLYEGFGLPILEAWNNGCPVCLSDTSCFPEIAGGAACYFDPADKESILHAVEKVLIDKDYSQSLKEKGKLRLQHFSITDMAENTCAIYQLFQ